MRLLILFVATTFQQISNSHHERHTKSAPCPENYECQSTRACGNMWKAHESVLLVSMTRTLVRKVCRARTPSHVWACPHPIPIRSTVENTASAMRKTIENKYVN